MTSTVHGLPVVCAVLLLAGCSSLDSAAGRGAVVAGAGAAGAVVGHELGEGKTLAVAGGALAGSIAGSVLIGRDRRALQEGFDRGYVQGQADSIRRQYWLRQALERERQPSADTFGRTVYYRLPGPELTEDGRLLEPHTLTIPVIE